MESIAIFFYSYSLFHAVHSIKSNPQPCVTVRISFRRSWCTQIQVYNVFGNLIIYSCGLFCRNRYYFTFISCSCCWNNLNQNKLWNVFCFVYGFLRLLLVWGVLTNEFNKNVGIFWALFTFFHRTVFVGATGTWVYEGWKVI